MTSLQSERVGVWALIICELEFANNCIGVPQLDSCGGGRENAGSSQEEWGLRACPAFSAFSVRSKH